MTYIHADRMRDGEEQRGPNPSTLIRSRYIIQKKLGSASINDGSKEVLMVHEVQFFSPKLVENQKTAKI